MSYRDLLPTRKIGASALAGAITTIAVWSINTFGIGAPETGNPDHRIPGEVGAAITTLLTFLVGYLVPEPDTLMPGSRT